MIDFKDAGIKPLSGLEIELRNMTGVDWSNYVQHVVKADELFTQYGCEPTEELIECINTMTPNVIYYSVYLKQENIMELNKLRAENEVLDIFCNLVSIPSPSLKEENVINWILDFCKILHLY